MVLFIDHKATVVAFRSKVVKVMCNELIIAYQFLAV